jgi:hypothetical protein
MMHSRAILAATLLLASALPAAAQSSATSPVSIKFANGNVTLVARDVPVRTILAEWARVGGSKIVNGERVTGTPVTLELTDVPERQALAVLLRNVSGYVAAARPAGQSGTSSFDRIMVLATPPPVQTAAAAQTTARPATTSLPAPVRFIGGEEEGVEFFLGNGGNPQPTSPTRGNNPAPAPAPAPAATNAPANAPRAPVVETEEPRPRPTGPTTMPSMPTFTGPAGSGRPGEISPVPQPRNQQQDER